jgi:hypothetical protein
MLASMGLPVFGCAGLGLATAIAVTMPQAQSTGRVSTQPVPPLMIAEAGELSLTILEPALPTGAIEVWLESERVALPENRLGPDDVVDPLARQPRVRGRFVAPSEPGEYRVVGHVLYVTCGPKWCRSNRADVTWTVTVLAKPGAATEDDADPETPEASDQGDESP